MVKHATVLAVQQTGGSLGISTGDEFCCSIAKINSTVAQWQLTNVPQRRRHALADDDDDQEEERSAKEVGEEEDLTCFVWCCHLRRDYSVCEVVCTHIFFSRGHIINSIY